MDTVGGYMTHEEESLPALDYSDRAPLDVDAGIGDLKSDKRGSGARFNTGKVPYELLPLDVAGEMVRFPPCAASEVLYALGHWQQGRDARLGGALRASCTGVVTLPALADAARVFEYGRKKYAAWNWAKGMAWSIPLGCAVRHCLAILSGETIDPESGLPHMGHVQCNLLMLLTFVDTFPEGDDRPVKWLKAPE